jgi:hypothetical protein
MAITVTVEDGPSVTVPWQAGMNAQEALETANQLINNTSLFTFALQYYGPTLGYLVLMINETYDSFLSSAAPFYYWELLLNGKPSPTGIDSTKLNDGDVITFQFTVYNASTHNSIPMGEKHRLRTSIGGKKP